MQKQYKNSKQRDALIALLRGTDSHPSADRLYTEMKKTFPNISIATVYRNLAVLEKTGAVIKLSLGGGREYYDGDTSRHYHLICSVCGRIIDVPMPYTRRIDKTASELTGADIDNHNIVFNGICADCKNIK